jgi:hypothetical protein
MACDFDEAALIVSVPVNRYNTVQMYDAKCESMPITSLKGRSVAGRGGVQLPRYEKMDVLNEINYSLRSTNFILLSQIKGNSLNNFDFLKFAISVMGGHCDTRPGRQKKPSYATANGH